MPSGRSHACGSACELPKGRANIRFHAAFAGVAIVMATISFTTVVATIAAFTAATLAIGLQIVRTRDNSNANPVRRSGVISVAAMAVAGMTIVGFQRIVIESNLTEGIRLYWSDAYVDRTTIRSSVLSLADRFTDVIAVALSLDPSVNPDQGFSTVSDSRLQSWLALDGSTLRLSSAP